MIDPRDESPFQIPPLRPDPTPGADPRDVARGNELRDAAIKQVTKNASEVWKEHAFNAALHVLRTRLSDMSTDDIWAVLATRNIEKPHENRAMAAVINRLRKEGYIEIIKGHVIQSAIPEAHRRNTQVWRILRRPEID